GRDVRGGVVWVGVAVAFTVARGDCHVGMAGLKGQGDALRSLLESGGAHGGARELSRQKQARRAVTVDRKRYGLAANEAGASGIDGNAVQVRKRDVELVGDWDRRRRTPGPVEFRGGERAAVRRVAGGGALALSGGAGRISDDVGVAAWSDCAFRRERGLVRVREGQLS